jgi:hypothetical protein
MPAAAVGAAIEHSCFSGQIQNRRIAFSAFINFWFPDFLLVPSEKFLPINRF